ncbi:MAG TPA: Xaa-Pro peptidase family protein [Solirubrobacteraceae bacterium]
MRVARALRERELDALLVTTALDVRYLTGFTGSNGVAVIAAEEGVAARFFTDFRYEAQSAEQVADAFEREIVVGDLLEAIARGLASGLALADRARLDPAGAGTLGFDDASLTVKQHARLRDVLPPEWELVPCAGLVGDLRAIKDEGELARIRAAAELADEALRGLLEGGIVHRTEREVAIELELRMRRLGAEAPSFPSIVAAGAHGALPHAEPRDVKIPKDVLVTIDWGALHEGYCSDCTRTYATGEHVSDEAREVYELVRTAQETALEAVRAGPTGRELDGVAREIIERAGHGEHFGHGLGHGVGMEVHEGPRLSRIAGEQPLRAGNVVTVEPGVYVPGLLGVRIEDLVVVTEDGQEILSRLGKELTVIS